MKWWFLPIVPLALVACSSAPEESQEPLPSAEHPNQVNWPRQKAAASYELKADEKLNLNDDSPNSLMLCLYQLSDSAAFLQFSQSEKGVRELLECRNFSPSVVYYQRLYIQPGQTLNDVVDRHEDVRFLAVAAGYWNLDVDKATQLYEFPVEHTTTGSLFWKTDHYRPGKLAINIKLGEHAIWPE
ncbi:type VI secretion system-associated lipoprotein [Vibrio coralliilyticus]|uniref:type VI secretion system lipoprotein TssJ n=1 Tax=Vibrio coralliilyticus TaxID=190893 RepID=UPI0008106DC2|nr:type VI secretion system lipoprotein TssJ [Vibrio coralliilyticus]ANW25628.1 type VI secretion system-associated lipoprotein [Vibrio coralliilyticus]